MNDKDFILYVLQYVYEERLMSDESVERIGNLLEGDSDSAISLLLEEKRK